MKVDPRVSMTIKEIVESAGFTFEYHNVTTSDGYKLGVHRLYTPNTEGAVSKPVVFLQHGILSLSDTFVINGDKSLAFILASEGYDVWMGNSRGGYYSRAHINLDPDNPTDQQAFFDYSFYEMAKYDEPAMIDYVLNITAKKTVSYVAHSQGTALMFTALAEGFGDLHEKLNIFVALAPVTYLQDESKEKALKYVTKYAPLVQKDCAKFKFYELYGIE